jgi:hypothetical protein
MPICKYKKKLTLNHETKVKRKSRNLTKTNIENDSSDVNQILNRGLSDI